MNGCTLLLLEGFVGSQNQNDTDFTRYSLSARPFWASVVDVLTHRTNTRCGTCAECEISVIIGAVVAREFYFLTSNLVESSYQFSLNSIQMWIFEYLFEFKQFEFPFPPPGGTTLATRPRIWNGSSHPAPGLNTNNTTTQHRHNMFM